VEECDVVTDVVAMMAGPLGQGSADPAGDLARALTTLQLGIELLAAAAPVCWPSVERQTLTQMLIATSERIGATARVLIEETRPVE
jgi:hypothetical protein